MEVKSAAETDVTFRRLLPYVAFAALLVGVLFVPGLVFEWYPGLLHTLLLLGLLGLVGRTLLSALIAFRSPGTPNPDRPAAELPPVSVLIPAYDEAAVLPDTIQACRDLDYPAEKLEVVLCYEAASTDGTAAICEAAAAADERFVAVARDEPGGGKAAAANYALSYLSHDLIVSVDADHRFKPDAVRRMVAWFEADEDVWCVKGRCYGANPADSLVALHATVERHVAEKADLFARQVIGGFTLFGGGQAAFRRAVFDELGDFDETVLVEDIDMSSRIHAAGKEIRMDPSVITYEENPPTAGALWSQRKRWVRGWMQVAERYLPRLPRDGSLSLAAKLDAVYTFSYTIIPTFLVVAVPVAAYLLLPGFEADSFLPYTWTLWAVVAVSPVVVAYVVFLQDWRDGLEHHPYEYLAAFTFGLYLVPQALVFLVSFVDEFVLGRPNVYVTTTRSGASGDASSDD